MTGSADHGIDHAVVRGREVVRLHSAELELTVVPSLGAAVTDLRRRGDGLGLTWATPWGLPGPATGLLGGSAEELRADADPGGWQTLFPNAGDNAVVDGIEWGQDGEARITPFDLTSARADDDPDGPGEPEGSAEDEEPVETGGGARIGSGGGASVRLVGRLRRSPFTITKTVTVEQATVRVTERIEHHGHERVDVLWGSRICLATPLVAATTEIDSGASLVHPDGSVQYDADYDDVFPWPRMPGRDSMINLRYLPEPGGRQNRTAYLTGFGEGWLTIANPAADARLRLGWDATVWPHLWYQLEDGGTLEHPWFGAERFLALTPCSGWPARGVHDARRISGGTLAFDPGQVRTAELTLTLETDG